MLKQLNEHKDNLLSSNVTSRAINDTAMDPLGKVPITLTLGTHRHTDTFHIYPSVNATVISWKAAKALSIPQMNYPSQQIMVTTTDNKPAPNTTPQLAVTTTSEKPVPPLDIQLEYLTAFDGQIKTMDGERFHITFTKDAKPFCINTPRTVPFAFRDKLKAELDLLQDQGVIAPVTEPTEWCSPIVVAPKKGTDKIRMCVDLSHLNKL